jgi:membrane associated rhomboid family serine protease
VIIPLRTTAIVFDVPYVTLIIMLLNCAVFLLELNFPGGPIGFIKLWGMVPARIWTGGTVPGTDLSAWWTTLSGMFTHFDFFHLFGNMLYLWIFGPALEWLCGRARFFLLYLGAGLLASLITIALGYAGRGEIGGAGASGAVGGLMFAFLLVYPRSKVVSWCFLSLVNLLLLAIQPVIRSISVYWFVGFCLLVQIYATYYALTRGEMGPYGVYAHVGGAIGGGLLVFNLLIPARRPEADHHTQQEALTTVIIGEEGDAAARPLSAEEQALMYSMSPAGRLDAKIRALRSPFKDTLAESLFASGDLNGVRQHCAEMLEVARRDMNPHRIEAYEMLLAELAQRETEATAERAAAERAEQVRATLRAPSQRSMQSGGRSGGYGMDEGGSRGSRRPPPR